jgi:ABC-type antimicrobial peptide transport system permease subunit
VNTWESIRIALRALRTNKMRTGLTMLGIVIGVGAVIAMVALGQGAAASIRKQFESMGTNLVVVRPGSPRMFGPGPGGGGPRNTLVQADAEAIARRFPDTIAEVASVSRGSGDVKMGAITWNTQVIGGSPAYGAVTKTAVEAGRFLNADEEKGRARVAVVGRSVIEKLTGDRTTDLIGQDIEINRTRFRVVGTLKERGVGAFGQDQDDLVVIPCSTAMRRVFNRTYLNEIDMMCQTEADIPLATEQVVNLLRERHKLRPPFPDNDDFNVRSQSQILEASAQSSSVMTALLGSIAFVSLMVGGIGIMNIMLVSVTERTREIGIRKAVGARRHDILMQFVIEALVIALLGGLIGIGLGVGTVLVITHFLQWNALIQASSIILSVVVSAAIGLFFGIYPAFRAARLNPIDALRYE